MKTTLNIPQGLLDKAVELAGVRTKTEAVTLALKELIRRQKIEHLIKKTGTLEFSDDWEKARHER
jgi:Arc/MetJ family transcription regulator